jgi:hypothetical protein
VPLELFFSGEKSVPSTDFHLPISIDHSSAQSINSGRSYIYFYGHVVYDDIFNAEQWASLFLGVQWPIGVFAPWQHKGFNKNT